MILDLKTSSDYTLIKALADGKSSHLEHAFCIFHERYASYIFSCSAKIVIESNLFPNAIKDIAADISQEVFLKVLQRAGSFEVKSNQTSKDETKHIQGWLYRIIKNLFVDKYLRTSVDQSKIVRIDHFNRDQLENEIFCRQNNEAKKSIELSSEQQKMILLIKEGYDCLNEKEKDIINFYLQSGTFDDRGNWVLPPERMEELCTKYGLKKNSIIQRKKRIIEKIKAYIQNKVGNNEHK